MARRCPSNDLQAVVSMPALRAPLRTFSDQSNRGESAIAVPSAEPQGNGMSRTSSQPPGLRLSQLENPSPVVNAHAQHTRVDEVELAGEGPFSIRVIDQKLPVWGHKNRLYGRQVGADDVGMGMFICKLDSPHSCPASYVQDRFHSFWYWRHM